LADRAATTGLCQWEQPALEEMLPDGDAHGMGLKPAEGKEQKNGAARAVQLALTDILVAPLPNLCFTHIDGVKVAGVVWQDKKVPWIGRGPVRTARSDASPHWEIYAAVESGEKSG